MSATWSEKPDAAFDPPGPLGWVLLALRALVFGLITLVLFVIFMLLRLLPWQRPAKLIVGFWNHLAVWFCGLSVRRVGTPMREPGARVSNHASWMDPLTLRVAAPMQFVSKADVAGWPVIGTLARTSGVVFIERKRSRAATHQNVLLERLKGGEQLCFFPEGTSSDGLRVLPFKSTLFEVFLSDEMREITWVQPMSLIYRPRKALRPDFYGWWGKMGFGGHLVQILSQSWGGEAVVVFHAPVRAADFADRKALARHCEAEVKAGFERYAGDRLAA